MIKSKSVIIEEEYDSYLILTIHHVEGIDNLSIYPCDTAKFGFNLRINA